MSHYDKVPHTNVIDKFAVEINLRKRLKFGVKIGWFKR